MISNIYPVLLLGYVAYLFFKMPNMRHPKLVNNNDAAALLYNSRVKWVVIIHEISLCCIEWGLLWLLIHHLSSIDYIPIMESLSLVGLLVTTYTYAKYSIHCYHYKIIDKLQLPYETTIMHQNRMCYYKKNVKLNWRQHIFYWLSILISGCWFLYLSQ